MGPHFCSAYNRKKTEGNRRIHARKCATCKEMLQAIIRQRLLAEAGKVPI